MTIALRYRCEPPSGVACLGFHNVSGRRLSVMPPGGTAPIEIAAGGRVLIPRDDLAGAPDLVHWLVWLRARGLVAPIDP